MDDMTCKTFVDEAGNVLAKACASGDAKIEFDSNFENTYYTNTDFPAGNPYGEMVDMPWYQDIWYFAVNQFNAAWGNPLGQVLIIVAAMAIVAGVCWFIFDRASWKDYAPDAWDAEDRIEELNAEADWRTHGSDEENQDKESYPVMDY